MVSEGDKAALAVIADERGFSASFLTSVGAGVYDLDALRSKARADRELEDELRAAGVVRPELVDSIDGSKRSWLKGFYSGKRIVFPLGEKGGAPAGYAARALAGEEPKYLYSFGFPRRDTLYGAERVVHGWKSAKAAGETTLYIVEGLFDQLRLESLGFNAVAILGAKASGGQINQIRSLVETAAELDKRLRIRIFLDSDAAGRRGAYDLSIDLFRLLDAGVVFTPEVTSLSREGAKSDPDTWLRSVDIKDADKLLSSHTFNVFEYLLAYRADKELSDNFDEIPPLELATIAHRVVRSLPSVRWQLLLTPFVFPDRVHSFVGAIRAYSEPKGATPVFDAGERATSPRAQLISALNIGRSSAMRREYPIDDEAWERLNVAATPLYNIHKKRLSDGDGPSSWLLSRYIPKGGGAVRLKAGPVAADALLQQYMLLELLREHSAAVGFSSLIPAVRYDRSGDGSGIYQTGASREAEALSFAYQVDDAVVNGRAPPAREGMFRPYYECWRSFIDFLENKIRTYRHDDMQILRLDISSFYENVRSDHVHELLEAALEPALALFKEADGGCLAFASLFKPTMEKSAKARGHAVADWLTLHAFHNVHSDPITGAQNALKGLAQGADLSSYLANLSLFSLDEMMRAEVAHINASREAGDGDVGCSAAYARYVDDIVIVCPTTEIALMLRRKIESHLQVRGLSLNRKNATPPLMTRAQARAWLTDNRSGFGFSGPLSEMPVTAEMDPLADAGDIDRRTALGLLFDPLLDDLRQPKAILQQLDLALSANEVRFSDRANAYRRYWQLAATNGGDANSIADEFVKFLSSNRTDANTADARVERVLAAVEALERALRVQIPDRLDDDLSALWRRSRQNLASAVLEDVVRAVVQACLGSIASDFLNRFDVRSHVAVLACLADNVGKTLGDDRKFDALAGYHFGGGPDLPAIPQDARLSLYRHCSSFHPGTTSLLVPSRTQAADVFFRLEKAIVDLQHFAAGGRDLSPLDQAPDIDGDLNSVALAILDVWCPSDKDAPKHFGEIELDAVSTLINVAHKRFQEICSTRPLILKSLLKSESVKALPAPPGLKSTGVMAWCDNGVLVFIGLNTKPVLPLGVDWTAQVIDEGTKSAFGQIPVFWWEANLGHPCVPLFEADIDWNPGLISQIYRAGFKQYIDLVNGNANAVPVPTAFSFFGKVGSDRDVDPEALRVVCWNMPREEVDGHAFVVVGSALEARTVHANGAELWRYGWAVLDVSRRPSGPADDADQLDKHGDTPLEREGHRRDALLARVLPRLTGDQWGPGHRTTASDIPTRIERALRLLSAFEQTAEPSEQATYLVAATAEGAFMAECLQSKLNLNLPGALGNLATRAAKRVTRALPAAAKIWPASKMSLFTTRRSAAAWLSLAERLEERSAGISEDARKPINSLVCAYRVTGISAELRAICLEIISALPSGTVRRLGEVPIDLSDLSASLPAGGLLIAGRPNLSSDIDDQLRGLFQALADMADGRLGANEIRDLTTPLGWLLALSTLLQVTPPLGVQFTTERPNLWVMSTEARTSAKSAIEALIHPLSAAAPDIEAVENWPWGLFAAMEAGMNRDLWRQLANLTRAARLVVEDISSSVAPRTTEHVGNRTVYRMPDGTSYPLCDFQVDPAFLFQERQFSIEGNVKDGRLVYRYSVSKHLDRVVGFHFATAAFGKVAFSDGSAAEREQGSSVTEATDRLALSPSAADVRTDEVEPLVAHPAAAAPNTSDHTPSEDELAAVTTSVGGAIVPPSVISAQEKNWFKRAKRDTSRQRIAFVQWDVTNTYDAPGARAGELEGLVTLSGDPATPEQINDGGYFQSHEEFRRRAILKQVLRACDNFRVDGLVLPEYSVRPETVNWLARYLRNQKMSLTVWCGTFRVPDGSMLHSDTSSGNEPFLHRADGDDAVGLTPWRAHAALLTCLDASNVGDKAKVDVYLRPKRYPSAASKEAIVPHPGEPWVPLLHNERNPFRLGAYTVDLVCSEMFAHASSANFMGILDEVGELCSKYALQFSMDRAVKDLYADIRDFAKWTSYRNIAAAKELYRSEAMQRSIIILPAMTSRSADYHIFGQNQYLAAGLVTVFCNAVEPGYGCGGSAFIGLDGWKQAGEADTPYGSIAPGIFIVSSDHTGPLKPNEAAMVIADVDPLHTTDLKPRPHYQGRSLELVAHLPLIFSTKPSSRGGRRIQRKRSDDPSSKSFAEAAEIFDRVLQRKNSWRDELAYRHSSDDVEAERQEAVQLTVEALKVLEDFADNRHWLNKRTEAFKNNRWRFVAPDVLPALVDWLYIDDEWRHSAELPSDSHPLTIDQAVIAVPRDSSTTKFSR
ncbi:reverse transcriptase domain-containing protein [Devosia sp. MC532]|uniref:reverse transcriptase domain-containing protein n=1 Tax=Devosia sp. MC532 TaxID=2799788 RepID=UPI0020BE1A3D|nr:reverse transcriptase domain-containing protein [Devosia sp. MC532]